MVNRVMLRKLVRDLLQRKGSLLVLVIIAAVGVSCYVGMAGVFRDMDGARAEYYRDYRLADFTVDLKRAPAWTVSLVRSLPNVRAARGRVSLAVLLDVPGVQDPVSGRAISMPEKRDDVINGILLCSGTWFSGRSDREVIINDAFARENGLHPGSRLKVLLLDKQHELLVVGTAMSPEFVYVLPPGGGLAPDPKHFGILYLGEGFLRKSAGLEGAYNQVVGLAHDSSPAALRHTLALIEARLDAYGVTNTTPVQDQPSVRYLADELKGLKVTAATMPVIFLGVAALVLNVLMARMVVQHRTLIGMLRAIGYTPGFITRHYLSFGALVGMAGGVLGVIVGNRLQLGMGILYARYFALPSIEAHFYGDVVCVAVGTSLAFAVAGTLKGVHAAARLRPAEAMRPPPPEKGVRIFPERFVFLWRRLPFRWKMILRTVFRNPFRSSVSVFAAVVSTALIFAAFSNLDAMNYLIDYEFEKILHQDMTVAFRDPRGRRSAGEIAHLPTVSAVEPQLNVVCDLSNGSLRKRIGVTGIAPGNRLYTPLDGAGRPIVVPHAGIVLTKKLAEILKARPGDALRLRPLVGRRVEVTAPVVGVVDTFLGLSAYADIGYLSRLIGEEWSANTMLCSLFAGGRQAPLVRGLKERPAVVGIGRRPRLLAQIDEAFQQTMGVMIMVLILFAGLVAFGSVLNTALVSLSEREREVGTFRVLGYTPCEVLAVFAGESFLLNSLGVAAGMAAGVGLAKLLSTAYNTELYRFPAVFYPSRFAISAALMIAFITLAQLVIYRVIQKLAWLEVLKYKE